MVVKGESVRPEAAGKGFGERLSREAVEGFPPSVYKLGPVIGVRVNRLCRNWLTITNHIKTFCWFLF